MATLRERAPGIWEVRVFVGRNAKGRPIQVSRTVRGGRRAAERVAAGLTVDRPSPSASRTVADLLEVWQALNQECWTESTRRNQASRARLITEGTLGRKTVGSLKVEDIDRWILSLRAAGAGRGSIHNQLQVLRAALSQALKWGWVSRNPAALATATAERSGDRLGMPDDAVAAVIAAAPHRPAAIAFRIAAATGARRAELAALCWDDLRGKTLTIGAQIVVHQQGTKDNPQPPQLERDSTKTRRIRTVTLDPGTLHLLEEWRVEHGQLGPWLLAVGERPPSPDSISWWWRHAREAAGISKHWRLHDLRHWSATTAIDAGTDVRTVANRLGHANPAMTLKVYAHAIAAADAGAAQALGDALDGRDRP